MALSHSPQTFPRGPGILCPELALTHPNLTMAITPHFYNFSLCVLSRCLHVTCVCQTKLEGELQSIEQRHTERKRKMMDNSNEFDAKLKKVRCFLSVPCTSYSACLQGALFISRCTVASYLRSVPSSTTQCCGALLLYYCM